jgi:hypothetical protein
MNQYNIGDKVIYIGIFRYKSGTIDRVLERGFLIRWDAADVIAHHTVVSFAKLNRMAKVCNNETIA